MKTFNKKGLYNSYDRNHRERDALDYYSTPTEEVENILSELKIDFNNKTILEPSCGGGHMVKGIMNYIKNLNNCSSVIFATDIVERANDIEFIHSVGSQYDFLSDNYQLPTDKNIDYIIMNPPYSTIEPFVIRALEIADEGVLMLARLQFLEGQGRYDNILKNNPPSKVFVYVDRIKCNKNGDPNISIGAVQAYAWFYWDKTKEDKTTNLYWIRRANKKE